MRSGNSLGKSSGSLIVFHRQPVKLLDSIQSRLYLILLKGVVLS